MTLRYEGGQPVGLDWPAITTGHDPEVWKNASESLQRTRAKSGNDGVFSRPARTRIAHGVEMQIVRMYRDELMSAKEIAAAVGVQSATVFKALKRNNVPSRTKSEGMKLSRAKRAGRGVEDVAVGEFL